MTRVKTTPIPPTPPAAAQPKAAPRWLAPLAIGATAALMLRWSWGMWPDVLVDFGQQLYIPWRLAQGDVLHRDLAWYNGPLSVYANAALFRVFGVGLRTLVMANLVLLALLIGLLSHVFREAAGKGVANWAAFTFVLLFACAQYVGVGNYNYVCPYAHEMTHGLLFGLAALACVWRYRRGEFAWLAIGGFCLGLAFLTKAEVFQAALAGVGVALGLGLWRERPGWRRGLLETGVFAAAALIPPLIAFAGFCRVLPAHAAAVATLGSWVGVFNPTLVNLPFFRRGMGLDDPSGSLRSLVGWAAGYACLFAPAALGARRLRVDGWRRSGLALLVFLAVTPLIWVVGGFADWFAFARPLPLAMFLIGAGAFVRVVVARRRGTFDEGACRQVALAVFALALMGKMILNARIYHYGFVLAMPATLLMIAFLLDWVPAAIDRAGGTGAVFRAVALAALLVVAMAFLGRQAQLFSTKTYRVGDGADAFWAGERGKFVNDAVAYVGRKGSGETTVTALPEGIMINYLSRRRTASRFTTFLPTEVAIFGEEAMLEDLRKHPPELVALVHKDTSETGFRFFGADFGTKLYRWVLEKYEPSYRLGARPLESEEFGILFLERR